MIYVILTMTGLVLSNMLIQLAALLGATNYLVVVQRKRSFGHGTLRDTLTMGTILGILLGAHMLQISLWALVFLLCGEFEDFETAFYHSAVNFSSLGYGDIVMSDHWRLLGAIESAVGVLMFGVSAALLFAVVNKMLRIRLKDSHN